MTGNAAKRRKQRRGCRLRSLNTTRNCCDAGKESTTLTELLQPQDSSCPEDPADWTRPRGRSFAADEPQKQPQLWFPHNLQRRNQLRASVEASAGSSSSSSSLPLLLVQRRTNSTFLSNLQQLQTKNTNITKF